jgi:triosephosphate isomerase
MSARTILIAGNWKMNASQEMASGLIEGIKAGPPPSNIEMLVCPPFPYLGLAVASASGSTVQVGAQTCHTNVSGAHTGDVSAVMLKDMGCSHVIVGHSERRTDHGETDEHVMAQASAAIDAGLVAIICVGETEAERDAGSTLDVVASQIAGSTPTSSTADNTVIAYEPVWAIGTGRTPTADEVQDVHAAIRSNIAAKLGQEAADGMRILYGGSMKPSNAEELLALADVDGGLIGGASLKAEDFLGIANAAP